MELIMDKQRARQLYELADRLSKLDVNTLSEEQLSHRNTMIAKLQEEVKIIKEFAPPGSSDSGNDGFSEETLKRLAAQWWNGDEDPRVEQTLMAAGWEIGQDEGYDNGGAFVVQADDINGNSYISWPAEELEGLTEGTDNSASATPAKNERGRFTALDDDEPIRLKCEDGEFRTIQEINVLRQKIGMKPFSIKRQQGVAEGSGDPEITPGMKTQYGTVVSVKGNTVTVKASNGELTTVNILDIQQGVAEASWVNGKLQQPEDLVWKQTSLSYDEAVNKYGKEAVRREGKNRLGQEVIAVHVPLGGTRTPALNVAEGELRVDSLVTDALKIMKGAELNDAVSALKTVLGNREYNDRRGHYNFYVRQLMDMYSQQGVTEGVAETVPIDYAKKVLGHYGADHFKTTSNELHFYKNGKPMSVDLIMNDDATRSVSLSQLNSASRQLKGQGMAEAKKPSPQLTPVNIKKTDTVSEEINNEAYERLQKVFAFKNYES